MKKGKFENDNQSKNRNKSKIYLCIVLLFALVLVSLVCAHIAKERKGADLRANAIGNAFQNTGETMFQSPVAEPVNREISFGFIDHTLFSKYWTNGIFKCGSDFEPGDYYILSLCMGGATFDVSNDPNDFPWTDYRFLRKISVDKGQYVNIPAEGIMVYASEVEANTWDKFGVYLVGRDLPEGDYKIVSISDEYCSELYSVIGICGSYQICNNDPAETPVSSSLLYNSQAYISLKNGQYITINNARLTLDEE